MDRNSPPLFYRKFSPLRFTTQKPGGEDKSGGFWSVFSMNAAYSGKIKRLFFAWPHHDYNLLLHLQRQRMDRLKGIRKIFDGQLEMDLQEDFGGTD